MYLILEFYNEVSPTLAGLACVCMLACSYLPYKVQNKNTIFKHVLLKQDVDSSGFSDYTTAHECKHLSMSESLLIVSDILYKCNNCMSLVLYVHKMRFIGTDVRYMLESKRLCPFISSWYCKF